MAACSVEEIRLRLDQVKVVAVTCLGISSPLLANRKFDVCIMDEAGQITLPVSPFLRVCVITNYRTYFAGFIKFMHMIS